MCSFCLKTYSNPSLSLSLSLKKKELGLILLNMSCSYLQDYKYSYDSKEQTKIWTECPCIVIMNDG